MRSAGSGAAFRGARERRISKLRELLAGIQASAGYAVLDLDRDRIPRLRNLLDDANRIAALIAGLEAIEETGKILTPEED